jgi:hypothetical protein
MIRNALCVAGLFIILAAPLAAQTPYHEQRQLHYEIDDAVAALPTSDIHGTLNRISAMYQRGQIRDLLTDAGTDGDLPENFVRGMDAALLDLKVDLKDVVALEGEDEYHKAVLLLTINAVAFSRNVDLYQNVPDDEFNCWIPAGGEQEYCRPSAAVTKGLDSIANMLKSTITELIQAGQAEGGPHGPPLGNTMIHAHNFDAWAEKVRINYGYVRGLPHIED